MGSVTESASEGDHLLVSRKERKRKGEAKALILAGKRGDSDWRIMER